MAAAMLYTEKHSSKQLTVRRFSMPQFKITTVRLCFLLVPSSQKQSLSVIAWKPPTVMELDVEIEGQEVSAKVHWRLQEPYYQ